MQAELQDHLAAMRASDAPLPLGRAEGLRLAVEYRTRGWSYEAITRTLGTYHGLWYAERSWRQWCREAGAPRKHPHRGFGAVS